MIYLEWSSILSSFDPSNPSIDWGFENQFHGKTFAEQLRAVEDAGDIRWHSVLQGAALTNGLAEIYGTCLKSIGW